MNLHEYQGKNILHSFGIKVPLGKVARTPYEAITMAKKITKTTGSNIWIVKAQIHAGGRGKGGGIKMAKSLKEVYEISSKIIGMRLITPQTPKEGKLVHRVMIGQDVYYKGKSEIKEYYISILIDRNKEKNIIMYSQEGGVDIEQIAKESQEQILIEEIDPYFGIFDFQAKKIAFNMKLPTQVFKEFIIFIKTLYKAYVASDASMIEINPLLKTSDNKIIAVDTKVVIDDNALYRHPDYAALRDIDEEDPYEVEAAKAGLNFVKLDSNVGCIVNGAGLAMATMDLIKLSGVSPANFLDVGGTVDAHRVEKAVCILLKDKTISAIFINIFGGIVRCDTIAQGIIAANQIIEGGIHVPLIVRLQGTNAKEAKKMIDQSRLCVHYVVTLKEAAAKIKEILI
ncbi:ADP-forming succinate--CoA ligase subunit beta [Candidatus Walczuchella monophlebidarum]|uniref:Succinate--CoA ligase [ADP-forming] subunit beta n=1 Tax=Candidatus Walczuchella monophlebidarum TaxID=1415657 RepID=A0A068DP46_9FLAO|nr:ADP-forming succinate--CoA ligase subunit beta [Candidatus Walczuchella monophlebidarum]AID37520.1 succinyl-CoA synthetase subunit beta [Candidatus Walczuchella monophlebidarum]